MWCRSGNSSYRFMRKITTASAAWSSSLMSEFFVTYEKPVPAGWSTGEQEGASQRNRIWERPRSEWPTLFEDERKRTLAYSFQAVFSTS